MSITSIFLIPTEENRSQEKGTCNIIVIIISEHLLKNFSWLETDKRN